MKKTNKLTTEQKVIKVKSYIAKLVKEEYKKINEALNPELESIKAYFDENGISYRKYDSSLNVYEDYYDKLLKKLRVKYELTNDYPYLINYDEKEFVKKISEILNPLGFKFSKIENTSSGNEAIFLKDGKKLRIIMDHTNSRPFKSLGFYINN